MHTNARMHMHARARRQMHEFFNRCEVRDITGETTSCLFGDNNAGLFNFRDLRAGSTLFVRYACKCYFSDLSTQVGRSGCF